MAGQSSHGLDLSVLISRMDAKQKRLQAQREKFKREVFYETSI